jgi:hypothetical protein
MTSRVQFDVLDVHELPLRPPLAGDLEADAVAGVPRQHLNKVLALDHTMFCHLLESELFDRLLIQKTTGLF